MHPSTVLRVARPTDKLAAIARMYQDGLGFRKLGEFRDHAGFDGVMLGLDALGYHLEFTHCCHHPAPRAPTQDHLLVFYLPDQDAWDRTCTQMEKAGFVPVASFNPYWDLSGRTFEDVDGYRVVIQRARWEPSSATATMPAFNSRGRARS